MNEWDASSNRENISHPSAVLTGAGTDEVPVAAITVGEMPASAGRRSPMWMLHRPPHRHIRPAKSPHGDCRDNPHTPSAHETPPSGGDRGHLGVSRSHQYPGMVNVLALAPVPEVSVISEPTVSKSATTNGARVRRLPGPVTASSPSI